MSGSLLLCTDLDRTLAPNGVEPEHPRARPLFRRLVDDPRVTLVYVTGRDVDLTAEVLAEYELPEPDFLIADVGTTLAEGAEGNWQRWAEWDETIAEDWGGRSVDEIRILVGDVPPLRLQDASRQGRFKLSYEAPLPAAVPALVEAVRAPLVAAGLAVNLVWSLDEQAGLGLLDVLPASADKLLAIEFLREHLGFGRRETLFAGDSGNDLSVLTSALPAVIVANAADEFKLEALRAARSAGLADRLYVASGAVGGLDGNYAAGILEGVLHYHDGFGAILEDGA